MLMLNPVQDVGLKKAKKAAMWFCAFKGLFDPSKNLIGDCGEGREFPPCILPPTAPPPYSQRVYFLHAALYIFSCQGIRENVSYSLGKKNTPLPE